MSNVIKWAVLTVVLVSMILLVVNFWDEIQGVSAIREATSIVNSGLVYISPYLKWAREFLNCLLPPKLVTVSLSVAFLGSFFRITARLVGLITEYIYR